MSEFNRWYNPGSELMHCLDCGAAVIDTELHSKWHDENNAKVWDEGFTKADHLWQESEYSEVTWETVPRDNPYRTEVDKVGD